LCHQPHRLRTQFRKKSMMDAVDPKLVEEVLQKFEEHMQFSMLSVSDVLKTFDKVPKTFNCTALQLLFFWHIFCDPVSQ
jgi:hypothetical protein